MYRHLTQLLTAARLISRSQGASISELMDRISISRRTVYRLIEALEDLRYPVYDEYDGKERHIKLNQEHEKLLWWLPLPKVSFSFEDRVILDYLFKEASDTPALAENIRRLRGKIAPLIADGGYSIADKESGAGESLLRKPVLIRAVPVGKATPDNATTNISALLQAIKEKCVCNVSYEAINSGSVKTYHIHPLAVFEHNGGMYAYVIVPSYGTIIILAIERIRALDLTEEGFTPPENFDAQKMLSDPFGIMLTKPFTARVKFNAEQASFIKERDWSEGTGIETLADGSIILTIETGGAYELKRWVMSYGAAAELLEPDNLRSEIAAEYAKGNALYSTI